jgi:hypothetical protein
MHFIQLRTFSEVRWLYDSAVGGNAAVSGSYSLQVMANLSVPVL